MKTKIVNSQSKAPSYTSGEILYNVKNPTTIVMAVGFDIPVFHGEFLGLVLHTADDYDYGKRVHRYDKNDFAFFEGDLFISNS